MNKRKFNRSKKAKPQVKPKGGMLQQQVDPEMAQDIPPQVKKQLETTNAALTDMLYDPKTKGSVQKMLQSGPPNMSIPKTVNTVFKRFEDIVNQKQGPMPLALRMGAGVHLFQEVMELGGAMGILPREMPEEQIQPILRDTMQQYIQAGLKDKSIDPIELQQEVEPLLSDEEHEIGMSASQEVGIPGSLRPQQSMQGMLQSAQAPLKLENANLKKQNQQMQGALQGVASQPEGGPQNG